nr:iron-sulfur assembly protein 2 [Quercus suber]
MQAIQTIAGTDIAQQTQSIMAAVNTPRSCLRVVNAASRSWATSSVTPARRYTQIATPLHLDFLAPAWQSPAQAHQTLPSSKLSIPRRSFATTLTRHARAITNARQDDDGNDMTITITPRAAHRLEAISAKESNPDLALRVSVESGGCHGFQYLMSLISTSDADATEDTIFENEAVVGKQADDGYLAKVVMDEPSLELLKGSQIDYTMELIGSQFKVTGIPGAKSSCGCGTSFDMAA